MKLVINQNQVGKFNMLGDEESLAFSLSFTDDEGQRLKVTGEGVLPPENYDGNTYYATFDMPGHEGDNPESWGDLYKDLFESLDFESLLKYHMKHSGWTTGLSYEAQRTMFVVFLDRYYDEIVTGINQAQTKKREQEIEQLERRIKTLRSAEETSIPDRPDLISILLDEIDDAIKKYKGWRDEYAKGNDSWKRWDTYLKQAKAKKNSLKHELSQAYRTR